MTHPPRRLPGAPGWSFPRIGHENVCGRVWCAQRVPPHGG